MYLSVGNELPLLLTLNMIYLIVAGYMGKQLLKVHDKDTILLSMDVVLVLSLLLLTRYIPIGKKNSRFHAESI